MSLKHLTWVRIPLESQMKRILIVSPYNDPSEKVKEMRVKLTGLYCCKLFGKGHAPISTLLIGLSFASFGALPTDTDTWANFSIEMVKGCDEVHVLTLPGWEESKGVKIEIETAERLNIPIKKINFEI